MRKKRRRRHSFGSITGGRFPLDLILRPALWLGANDLFPTRIISWHEMGWEGVFWMREILNQREQCQNDIGTCRYNKLSLWEVPNDKERRTDEKGGGSYPLAVHAHVSREVPHYIVGRQVSSRNPRRLDNIWLFLVVVELPCCHCFCARWLSEILLIEGRCRTSHFHEWATDSTDNHLYWDEILRTFVSKSYFIFLLPLYSAFDWNFHLGKKPDVSYD